MEQIAIRNLYHSLLKLDKDIDSLSNSDSISYRFPIENSNRLRYAFDDMYAPTIRMLEDNSFVYYDPLSDTWRNLLDDTLAYSSSFRYLTLGDKRVTLNNKSMGFE